MCQKGLIYVFDLSQNDNGKKVVKVGRTALKQNETISEVQNRLTRRFSTTHLDPFMIDGVIVTDNIKAEKYIFKLMNSLHVTRENYYFDKLKITKALDKVYEVYGIENTSEKTSTNNDFINIFSTIQLL